MRQQSGEFLKKLLTEKNLTPTKVLEVGSLDVNGTIHDYVKLDGYVGVDMREGRNVDVVINGHYLTDEFDKNSFDLVICFDTLEHDDKFWLTLEKMKEVLRPGGHLVIGAPGRNCDQHSHPKDYWRFMRDAFEMFFEDMEDVVIEEQKDSDNHQWEDEVYGWGKKI